MVIALIIAYILLGFSLFELYRVKHKKTDEFSDTEKDEIRQVLRLLTYDGEVKKK